jgi:hypothetical protein
MSISTGITILRRSLLALPQFSASDFFVIQALVDLASRIENGISGGFEFAVELFVIVLASEIGQGALCLRVESK